MDNILIETEERMQGAIDNLKKRLTMLIPKFFFNRLICLKKSF